MYADWSQTDYTGIMFEAFSTEGVDGSGISVLLYPNAQNLNIHVRLFVPCYNYQNGHYSSNLSLIYTGANWKSVSEDISDFVEDQIY